MPVPDIVLSNDEQLVKRGMDWRNGFNVGNVPACTVHFYCFIQVENNVRKVPYSVPTQAELADQTRF